MDFSKLNVCLIDKNCKPLVSNSCCYVVINDCAGNEKYHGKVPNGASNVFIEVQAGTYIVKACVLLPGEEPMNCFDTHSVIVTVRLNQTLRVNLLLSSVPTGTFQNVLSFIRKARILEIPESDIQVTAKTIMTIDGISKDEIINISDDKLRCKTAEQSGNKSKEISKEYQEIINIINQTVGSSIEEKKKEETKL